MRPKRITSHPGPKAERPLRTTARRGAESATGEIQRSDGNRKGNKPDSSENGMPEELHLKAGMGARMFMRLPALPEQEARKPVSLAKRNAGI